MISVIIPAVDNYWLTGHCISQVRRYASMEIEVILVDNGSKDRRLWELGADQYLHYQDRLGYPAAVNRGIERARGDLLLLLNNDAWPTQPGYDEQLANVLRYGFAIAAPVTNFVNNLQQMARGLHELSWNVSEASRLMFVAVMMRTSLVEEIGYLDEAYGLGNYEDEDYCFRVRQAGGKLAIHHGVFFYHLGHQTLQDYGQMELLRRNRQIFLDKWGRLPE